MFLPSNDKKKKKPSLSAMLTYVTNSIYCCCILFTYYKVFIPTSTASRQLPGETGVDGGWVAGRWCPRAALSDRRRPSDKRLWSLAVMGTAMRAE